MRDPSLTRLEPLSALLFCSLVTQAVVWCLEPSQQKFLPKRGAGGGDTYLALRHGDRAPREREFFAQGRHVQDKDKGLHDRGEVTPLQSLLGFPFMDDKEWAVRRVRKGQWRGHSLIRPQKVRLHEACWLDPALSLSPSPTAEGSAQWPSPRQSRIKAK